MSLKKTNKNTSLKQFKAKLKYTYKKHKTATIKTEQEGGTTQGPLDETKKSEGSEPMVSSF